MGPKNVIHLVMGASSAGKSTFIARKMSEGAWSGLPVWMAYELEDRSTADGRTASECVVHYNLFRPFENRVELLHRELLSDPVLTRLLEHKARIRAYFLIADRSEVIERCGLRQELEPHRPDEESRYPSQRLLELMSGLDWRRFHEEWLALLADNQIRVEIVHSSGSEFESVSRAQGLGLLGG